MDFRGGVALPGHFGVELDVRKLDERDRSKAGATGLRPIRRNRDRLHHGRVWQGEAGDGMFWQAHGDARNCCCSSIAPRRKAMRMRRCCGCRCSTQHGHYRDRWMCNTHGAWLIATGLCSAADAGGNRPADRGEGAMTFDPAEHPHRRYNPLRDEWILVSPHRAKRPWQGQEDVPDVCRACRA